MIFLYLILGHLLADFVFQPTKLVIWKKKSWLGVYVHALIHFLVYAVLLLPYLHNVLAFLILACIAVAHFIIDSTKIRFESGRRKMLPLFFADQAVHFFILMVAGMQFLSLGVKCNLQSFYANFYLSKLLVSYFIVLVGSGNVYEIVKYQFAPAKNSGDVFAPDFAPDRIAICKRMAVATVIYAIFVPAGLALKLL